MACFVVFEPELDPNLERRTLFTVWGRGSPAYVHSQYLVTTLSSRSVSCS